MNWTHISIVLLIAGASFNSASAADQANKAGVGDKDNASPGLHFAVSSCSDEPRPQVDSRTSNMWNEEDGIRSVTRQGHGITKIIATVESGCSSPPADGAYSLQGSSLTLSFKPSEGKTGAQLACSCRFVLTYEIEGLPARKLRARLKRPPGWSGGVNTRVMYDFGKDLERRGEMKEAIDIYRKAAGSGSVEAARQLGAIYDKGAPGVPRDTKKAQAWFEKAKELAEDQ